MHQVGGKAPKGSLITSLCIKCPGRQDWPLRNWGGLPKVGLGLVQDFPFSRHVSLAVRINIRILRAIFPEYSSWTQNRTVYTQLNRPHRMISHLSTPKSCVSTYNSVGNKGYPGTFHDVRMYRP